MCIHCHENGTEVTIEEAVSDSRTVIAPRSSWLQNPIQIQVILVGEGHPNRLVEDVLIDKKEYEWPGEAEL